MGMPWIADLLDTANGRPAELIMEMGTLSLRKRGRGGYDVPTGAI